MSAGIVGEAMRLVHRMDFVQLLDFRAALIEQGIFGEDGRIVIEDPCENVVDCDTSPRSIA